MALLPLIGIGAGLAALLLLGGDSTWVQMRKIRPKPGSVQETASGIVLGDVIQGGAVYSFQDLAKGAIENGFIVWVPSGSILNDPRLMLSKTEQVPATGFHIFARPGDKLPQLTPIVPASAPSSQGPGSGTSNPPAGDIPKPDWWPQGAPWPPPDLKVPDPSAPRPDWYPPSLPWPPPGSGGSVPTTQLPGPSKKADDLTPPPGAGSYVDAVESARGKLGGVAKLRDMASAADDTNPQIATWLRAVADAEYKRQRDKSISLGGTPLTIKSGYNGEPVAQHYGGTFAQLMGNNPGKKYNNTDWNVGKVWLLPLDWFAEGKPLPGALTGSGTKANDALRAKAKSVVNRALSPSQKRNLEAKAKAIVMKELTKHDEEPV